MKVEIKIYKDFVNFKASNLRHLIGHQDSIFKIKNLEIKQKVLKQQLEDENIDTDDFYMNFRLASTKNSQKLINQSLLISIYSFLEHELNTVCYRVLEVNNYKLTHIELDGEGIRRAKLYLEKVHNVDTSRVNSLWQKLITLNKIRNCIVHANGEVGSCKQKKFLENNIPQLNGVSIVGSLTAIEIETVYLIDCIEVIQEFLSEILELSFHE